MIRPENQSDKIQPMRKSKSADESRSLERRRVQKMSMEERILKALTMNTQAGGIKEFSNRQ